MSNEFELWVQVEGRDVLAGTVLPHFGSRAQSTSFRYASSFLGDVAAHALDPALPLVEGTLHTPLGQSLFGALADSAPDRWGRTLLLRREQARAADEGRRARTLSDHDLLLGVRDDLRQGALRLREPETGAWLAEPPAGVPRLVDLPRLLELADRVEDDTAVAADLAALVGAGSSLGGARPKAHVLTSDGALAIAKFPSSNRDTWDVMSWEKVTLDLAEAAGIDVPASALLTVAGRRVLVVERFDRDGANRVGYASGMTMTEHTDGQIGSYLDLADVIETRSDRATADLRQLWRRIVFSILVNNVDDHLRNHAFLHAGGTSWRLSPAFDLNPEPNAARRLSTAIDEVRTDADVGLALDVAAFFRLDAPAANAVLDEVRAAVAAWSEVATRHGLSGSAIRDMAPAFSGDGHRV